MSKKSAFEALKSSQVTLLLVPGESYNSSILKTLKKASKRYSKVLYVALNRPASKIVSEFKKAGIDPARFYFIDTVVDGMKACKRMKNCESVGANELVELSVRIGEVIGRIKPDLVIVDSFHTMQAYQEREVIARLAHDLIAKIDTSGCKGLFPLLAADRDAPLTKDLEMFVDYVAELK